jgi:hypothetical protein
LSDTQDKVRQHNCDKTDTDNCGPPFFVVHSLHVAALTDLVNAPDVEHETVDEGYSGEDGEGPRTGECDVVVAEVQESSGDCAEKNGEFKPREECSLGSEVYFRFDADRDVDT